MSYSIRGSQRQSSLVYSENGLIPEDYVRLNGSVILSNREQAFCYQAECKDSKDSQLQKLFGTIEKIREFFLKNYGLNGVDGKGKRPNLGAHWSEKAALMCDMKTCYLNFNDKYINYPEVVAHEYVHWVIKELRPLNYQDEAGALNESLADIFGLGFKKWSTGIESWQVADIRDISIVCRLDNRKTGSEDHGYVHENSRIPSHAFYQAVTITRTEIHGVISQIWFRSLLKITPEETFKSFALKTVAISEKSYPKYTQAVAYAWVFVGILRVAAERPVPVPTRNEAVVSRESRYSSQRQITDEDDESSGCSIF